MTNFLLQNVYLGYIFNIFSFNLVIVTILKFNLFDLKVELINCVCVLIKVIFLPCFVDNSAIINWLVFTLEYLCESSYYNFNFLYLFVYWKFFIYKSSP